MAEVMPRRVRVAALSIGDSPRLDRPDAGHVRTLADAPHRWTPIVVHRPTMRVVDGVHRLLAARLRGDEQIDAILLEGTAEAAFVHAVKANIAHGLPLTFADRQHAASRILADHPQWSDRAVATAAGISAKSVAAIRRRATSDGPQLSIRTGLDGRVRPVSTAAARELACRILQNRPDASLREVARAAGIAPATVRDVRERMRRGEDPVPAHSRQAGERTPAQPAAVSFDQSAVLRQLRRDPSLRLTESGRALLRWLGEHAVLNDDWRDLADRVPSHCVGLLAGLARQQADMWQDFAGRITLSQRSASRAVPE